ncbi:hypothetical protein [Sulfurimonas sp.]|jgi:hypothetical protein|nr:hypothetical protein [Sulfurimonas sp.]
MPNKEHKIAEEERDLKDKKATTIVFSVMAVSLAACFIYIIKYA